MWEGAQAGDEQEALGALADRLAGRLPAGDVAALRELAAAGDPDSAAFERALAAVGRGLPYASLAALRAARALAGRAEAAPRLGARERAAAWLLAARIHALRREGQAAGAAADRAAGSQEVLSSPPGIAARALAESQRALAAGRQTDARGWLSRAHEACERLGDAFGQAETALELSQLAAEGGSYDQAEALADEVTILASPDSWLVYRAQLQSLDVQYYHYHYPEAARGYEAQAEQSFAADWPMEHAHVRMMQALIATQQGDLVRAGEFLQTASAIYQDEGSTYYVAVCRRADAMLLRRQGRFAEAVDEAGAALATFRDLEHTPATGRIHQALGVIYHEWSRYEAALAEYEQALPLLEAAGLRIDPLAIRVNQAEVQAERGYSQASLVCYQEALRMSQALRADGMAAQCLLNMGVLKARLGCHAEAVALYARGRRHFARIQMNLEAQDCAAREAGLLDLLGEHERARRLLAKARRYFRAGGHELPLAFCELTLAEMETNAGRHKAAQAHLAAALAYFETHGHELDTALCKLLLGESRLAAGDPAAAAPLLQDAVDRFGPDLPDHAARAEHALGRAAEDRPSAARHHQAAVAHLSRSRHGILTENQGGQYAAGRAAIYDDAIEACLAVDEPAALLAVVEAAKAQVLISLLQQRDVVQAAYIGQRSEAREVWDELWRTNRQLDALRMRWPSGEAGSADPAEPIASAGRAAGTQPESEAPRAGQARSSDGVGPGPAAGGPAEDGAGAQGVHGCMDGLSAAASSVHPCGIRGRPRLQSPTYPAVVRGMIATSPALSEAPGRATAQLRSLAARQAELFERVRGSVAGFDLLDLPAGFSLAGLRATAGQALGPGWAALAYYRVAADRLVVVWVTDDALAAWQRPLNALALAKIEQACDPAPQQRESVYAGTLRNTPLPAPPGPRLMRSLADLLIPAVVRERLAPDRPLLISPHGLLHYLPFHALRLDDDRPLVERAQLTYAPTLHVWQTLAQRALAHAAPRPPAPRALVVGVKDFGGRAQPLLQAEDEARAVSARFREQGAEVVEWIGPDATVERWHEWNAGGRLRSFDFVHLATHAVYDGDSPLLSRILLADGALTVPDIFSLRLEARLVTLSACQTALSKVHPGDELLGLREALLFAGARSLLVSQWHVDDASTPDLMARFYAGLLAGHEPASALAQAQRALLARGESAYRWAPFVLVG